MICYTSPENKVPFRLPACSYLITNDGCITMQDNFADLNSSYFFTAQVQIKS